MVDGLKKNFPESRAFIEVKIRTRNKKFCSRVGLPISLNFGKIDRVVK